MALISLERVGKNFGSQVVLADVSCEIQPGEKVGLIGPNGGGKTSMLRILAGTLEADTGGVHRMQGLRVGYLPQVPDLMVGNTVRVEALRAFAHLDDLEAEMRDCEQVMAESPDAAARAAALDRHGHLQEAFERGGGWDRERQIEVTLQGLGFHGTDFDKPVEALSGGEKNRLALGKVLLADPDLLILDEPTNYLDLATIAWLEVFLRDVREAVLVVSHDRRFLDVFASRILDLERNGITSYRGNYTSYATQKAERVEAQRRAAALQQAFIAKEEEYIRRFIAGQRSAQARGRRTRLQRLERLEEPTQAKTLSLNLGAADHSAWRVVEGRNLSKRYGARTLFGGLDFALERGERMGVVGPNGAGKTTLLRILRGEETSDSGEVRYGTGVTAAFYDQEHKDLALDDTVIGNLRSVRPDDADEKLRTFLGVFLFTDDEVEKRVRDLSGGERSRVALARLIASRANLLILDEPTNHLDIPSRDAVESALDEFEGSVIVVSHDRYFLDKIADRLLILEDGGFRLFAGGWSDWMARKTAESRPGKPGPPAAAAPREKPGKAPPPPKGQKRRSLDRIEADMIACEEAIRGLEVALADPANFRDGGKMRRLQDELAARKAGLKQLEAEWEGHAGG